jgi:putative endonuclease
LNGITITKPWFVYLIRVEQNNALYCGITNDLERRVSQHKSGKGAKWFRGKTIVDLVWFEEVENRSIASKREIQIKSFNKRKKEQLVSSAIK